MTRRSIRFALLNPLFFIIACVASHAAEPALFEDDFSDGLSRWEVLDPATWREGDGFVEITARESAYRPPHRSPGHVALARGVEAGDVAITFRVKSTLDTGPHRDCCVFFGWQDPAHFYYVHLGARPDPRSGQIMIVDGADRRPLTTNERPVPWGDGWHTVKVVRDTATGSIRVYFDDLAEPLLEATDKTFGAGRVGIGSFDDLCAFDDMRIEEGSADDE